MTAALFVYGTLRRDVAGSQFHRHVREATFLGMGRVRGRLFDLGAYPGLVPAGDGEECWVGGEVYVLADPATVLARLDEYEGCAPDTPGTHEFRRSLETVLLDPGEPVRAWVYRYHGPLAAYPEVLGPSPRVWIPRGA